VSHCLSLRGFSRHYVRGTDIGISGSGGVLPIELPDVRLIEHDGGCGIFTRFRCLAVVPRSVGWELVELSQAQ
jgi:hypothetical protein